MSKRILVVEDQADNRQIIRDMLAPTDYEITEAESGEEELSAIAKPTPAACSTGPINHDVKIKKWHVAKAYCCSMPVGNG
jgi:CheY-like chemotaxis protein